jgi:hypothetical protein
MKKKRIGYKIVLFWVCLIFTFLSLTSIVIFAASGYHMNWTNLSMEKTGLIWLRGEEKNIEILLNGKKKGKKIPIRLTNLFPGWYEITIKKEGYFTWRKSLNVEANQAYEVRNVMLFKKDQKPIAVNDQEEEKLIEKANVAVEVTTNKGEIYYGERLVTRFMDDPSFYVVYND